jgi:hypothetical protein
MGLARQPARLRGNHHHGGCRLYREPAHPVRMETVQGYVWSNAAIPLSDLQPATHAAV